MNTSNPIDISKSSIVGLKAELLRKQEEVKRLKELQEGNVKPEIIPKKKTIQQKSNEGVEKRNEKDLYAGEVDYDALQKSREVLEAKSRLYDKLKGNKIDDETKSKYLIDFDLKREIEKETSSKTVEEETKNSENEEDYSDSNSDPENDWVDFVDTLGRSRRCLRKDLPEMRDKDAKLAATLRPPSPLPDTTPAPAPTPTPELLSWDMQREMMRKKWEEQETLLLGKKDIHYQDVRFDEARPHGVGYFEFSTDEAERARQQEELRRLRAQTEEQQSAARGLRERRQQQMAARLAAARRRRRERLGLPPESPPREDETPTTNNEEEKEKEVEEESIEKLEESVKKIAPIRPWDIGKNGVAPVMTQEEWVEKKRQERPAEFAPPASLTAAVNAADGVDQRWKPNPNIFTSKKAKQKSPFSEKLKKKHKKLRTKKGEGLETQAETKVSDEESFGPSVQDWKAMRENEEESFGPSVQDWKATREREEMSFGPSVQDWKASREREEESFGPSVQDWKAFSQQNCMVLPDNKSYLPTQDCSTSSPANKSQPMGEIDNKNVSTPLLKPWKPSIADIDNLLSKSRAAISTTPLEETNQECSFPPNESRLTETIEPVSFPLSMHTEKGSYSVRNDDKSDYHVISTHSHRTNYGKVSPDRGQALDKSVNSETVIKPIVNLLEIGSDDEVEEPSKKCRELSNDKWKSNKRKFAEIPPPPSMSYYIDSDKKKPQNSSIKPQLADSISAGMNYLKSQTEEKSKKRLKGLLDII